MYKKEKNEKDILYILEHLRKEDKIEAEKMCGKDYVQKIKNRLIDENVEVLIGCKKSDNTPVCMGGCNKSEDEAIGVIWFLSTDEIKNFKHCTLRGIKKELKRYENKYFILYNFIFNRNYLAKAWLKKLGYTFVSNIKDIPENFELFYKKKTLRGLE